MTTKELQKRNVKSESLRVLQTDEGDYYVESAEGKILYRVTYTDAEESCTCADFIRNNAKDQAFKCKHIISVMNCIATGNVQNGQFMERVRPKLDERWIIEIEGHQFVKYAGLLDLGHQKGIAQIDVVPLQLPTKDNGNFAICKATVVSRTGESFSDIGDANPNNCSSKVSRHLLRLASTRAIARALRTYTNTGLTSIEEIDFADLNAKESSHEKTKTTSSKAAAPKEKANGKTAPKLDPVQVPKPVDQAAAPAQQPAASNGAVPDQPKISEAQKRAIYNLSRRRGISVEEVEKMAVDSYATQLENLSSKDASAFIRNLQQAA